MEEARAPEVDIQAKIAEGVAKALAEREAAEVAKQAEKKKFDDAVSAAVAEALKKKESSHQNIAVDVDMQAEIDREASYRQKFGEEVLAKIHEIKGVRPNGQS